MKISYNWLQELIPLKHTPHEIGHLLTAAGVAVDEVRSQHTGLHGAKTGEVLSVGPHPEAGKLFICTVDVGLEKLTIVTAAANVMVGQIVPVAVPGTILPDGREIRPADFRGVMSFGMLLSHEELGLDRKVVPNDAKEGIYVLPPRTPVGLDVCEVLGLFDYTLELDLTPNRSDCLGTLGVAHEVAALTGAKLVALPHKELGPTVASSSMLAVEIEQPDLCLGYLALVVEKVTVTQSPLWMQNALRNVGIKPVNNIVDITNYVMWELGQPLHAFDYGKIVGKTIIVRESLGAERMVTLDGEERQLPSGTVVIADRAGAVAIAGVMGSLASEVSSTTHTVVIESAYFNRSSIRRTSRSLGLFTAASLRFDKGVDPVGIHAALSRVAFLIEHLSFGVILGSPVGLLPNIAPWCNISLRVAKANSLLATELTPLQITDLLERLGFAVAIVAEEIDVRVPSRRRDVTEEIDLIEEIGRIYGLHQIPTTPLSGVMSAGRQSDQDELVQRLRGKLLMHGLDEIVTMSFADPAFLARLSIKDDHVWASPLCIQNPLVRERSVMRGTLISGMLEVLEYNQARQFFGMASFEIGRVFLPRPQGEQGQPEERLMVSLGAYGVRRGNWQTPSEILDYFYVKGVVDALLPAAGAVPSQHHFLHPGRQANIVVGGEAVGFLGEMHPGLGLRERFVVCEIDVGRAFTLASFEPSYQGLAKMLPMERDLAFLVPHQVEVAEVFRVMQEIGRGRIGQVHLFDVYTGPAVPNGMRSMAFRLEITSTMGGNADRETAQLLQEIAHGVERACGATLRGSAGS